MSYDLDQLENVTVAFPLLSSAMNANPLCLCGHHLVSFFLDDLDQLENVTVAFPLLSLAVNANPRCSCWCVYKVVVAISM